MDRYTTEAQAMARLRHGNVVTVYDTGGVSTARSSWPRKSGRTLTEEGSILRTVGYIAPEHLTDGIDDARSDPFSRTARRALRRGRGR
jgi:hypothetical protein